MSPSSLAHLPEPVLQQLLGGLLLTYFRSAVSEQGDLYLLREHQLPTGQNYLADVDWVIYDRMQRRAVGAFELARTPTQFRSKQGLLMQLREAANGQLSPMRVGLVAPESMASAFRPWAEKHDIELVTYPA